MSRILVTGATGSLGSALVRALVADGDEVSAMVLPGDRMGGIEPVRDNVQIRFADVRDPVTLDQAFRDVEIVYHVAGVAVTLNRLHRQMLAVNVDGARNVAEAAARAGVRRLVHTSSISAVGYPPAGEIADEHFDMTRSVCSNSYAETKTIGERALLEVAERRGLDAVVVNPSAVIAPYSDLRYGWAGFVQMAQRGVLRGTRPGGLPCAGSTTWSPGSGRLPIAVGPARDTSCPPRTSRIAIFSGWSAGWWTHHPPAGQWAQARSGPPVGPAGWSLSCTATPIGHRFWCRRTPNCQCTICITAPRRRNESWASSRPRSKARFTRYRPGWQGG